MGRKITSNYNFDIRTNPIPLTKSVSVISKNEYAKPLVLELESGWRIDGLKHFLLPVGMFKRLEMSCAGLVAEY